MAKKKKSDLEVFLDKKRPSFKRGSADCCAWVADYINTLTGEKSIVCKDMTFGDAVRTIQASKGLVNLVLTQTENLPFKEVLAPQDGDIIVYECNKALRGEAVGIYKEGAGITRMESRSLYITKDPAIKLCLRYSQ